MIIWTFPVSPCCDRADDDTLVPVILSHQRRPGLVSATQQSHANIVAFYRDAFYLLPPFHPLVCFLSNLPFTQTTGLSLSHLATSSDRLLLFPLFRTLRDAATSSLLVSLSLAVTFWPVSSFFVPLKLPAKNKRGKKFNAAGVLCTFVCLCSPAVPMHASRLLLLFALARPSI